MTWKHVIVLVSSLATMIICSKLGCASDAGEIAKLVAAGVIGNAMGTVVERKSKDPAGA